MNLKPVDPQNGYSKINCMNYTRKYHDHRSEPTINKMTTIYRSQWLKFPQIRECDGKFVVILSHPKHMLFLLKRIVSYNRSFAHRKHLFKLRGKKKIQFYSPKVLFTGPMGKYSHYDKRLANKSAYALNRLYIYIYIYMSAAAFDI